MGRCCGTSSGSPEPVTSRKAWALSSELQGLGRDILMVDPASVRTADGVRDLLAHSRPEALVLKSVPLSASQWADLCGVLEPAGVPVVAVDRYGDLPEDAPMDAVLVDRVQGAYAAVAHLAEQGCRTIALVASARQPGRLAGYTQALAEHGIGETILADVPEDQPPDKAEGSVHDLLTHRPDVTALFCATDEIAAGALRGAARAGRAGPDDLAGVGFDGDPWTAYLRPSLTTVAQPVEELAAVAAAMLRERLSRDHSPWRRVLLKPRLIVREPTCAGCSPQGGGEGC